MNRARVVMHRLQINLKLISWNNTSLISEGYFIVSSACEFVSVFFFKTFRCARTLSSLKEPNISANNLLIKILEST